MIEIRLDDLSGAPTVELLKLHLSRMHASSPPDHVFALDLCDLKAAGVTVWTAWKADVVVGIVALRELGDHVAEVKSMRTHPKHLRRGIAADLLDRVVREARSRGIRRLSLETGQGPYFHPALRLYSSRGFKEGEAFGEYLPSEFCRFLHLDL